MDYIHSSVTLPDSVANAETASERRRAIEAEGLHGLRATVATATVEVSLGGDRPSTRVTVPVAVLSHPDVPMRLLDDDDFRDAAAQALQSASSMVIDALGLPNPPPVS